VVVTGRDFFPLRIFWWFYFQQFRNGGRDVDIVNILQAAALEVWPGGIEDGLRLGQPRVVTMLSKKRRRLKEVAYGCFSTRVEVQVIAGDGNHQNIAAVLAKSMKISSLPRRFFSWSLPKFDVLSNNCGPRGFFRIISKTRSLVSGSLTALSASSIFF